MAAQIVYMAIEDLRPADVSNRAGAPKMPEVDRLLRDAADEAGKYGARLLPSIAKMEGIEQINSKHIFRMYGGSMMDKTGNSVKVFEKLCEYEPFLKDEPGAYLGGLVALYDECAQANTASIQRSISTPGTDQYERMDNIAFSALIAKFNARHTFSPEPEQYGSRSVMATYAKCAGLWPDKTSHPCSRVKMAHEREAIKQPNQAIETDFNYQGNSGQLRTHFLGKHLTTAMVNVELRCPARTTGGKFGMEGGVQYWGDVGSYFKLVKATKLMPQLDFVFAQEVVDMMEDSLNDAVNDTATPLSLCNATMCMLERVRTLILSLLGAQTKGTKGAATTDDSGNDLRKQLQSGQDKLQNTLLDALSKNAPATPIKGGKKFGTNGLEYKLGGQDSAAPCNRIKEGKTCFGACPYSHVGARPDQVNRPTGGNTPPTADKKDRKNKKQKKEK